MYYKKDIDFVEIAEKIINDCYKREYEKTYTKKSNKIYMFVASILIVLALIIIL